MPRMMLYMWALWAASHAGFLLSRLQVQAAALWNAINQRSILLPAVFVFLWQVWLLRVLQTTHTHLTERDRYAQSLSMHKHSLIRIRQYSWLYQQTALQTSPFE